VKASNYGLMSFGEVVSLSADGNTLAVGSLHESSDATGINGEKTNTINGAGAVYLFNRVGTLWSQNAYIKASNTGQNDFFGSGMSLSSDGKILAVGAYGESSYATGVNGDQSDNSLPVSGAVYLYSWSDGNGWSQKSYIKGSTVDDGDFFGYALSLSSDGNILAVGARCEDSTATGVNGDQTDNTMPCAGAVFMY
ncbi:MAG: FG-GAP repeat protein, partial [Gammaproteobacteria bacterium]|nr:FG-GAP repeat protein [Gammaproteobacteria bacterium]